MLMSSSFRRYTGKTLCVMVTHRRSAYSWSARNHMQNGVVVVSDVHWQSAAFSPTIAYEALAG